METPPRHYMALAFLPVALAVVALAALYVYQRGAEDRRDRWQQPEAVLDAVGVHPGMRVAEWHPTDTYFLERLERRVGSGGSVYAVEPSSSVARSIESKAPHVSVVPELPPRLDALLLLHVSAAQQDLAQLKQELAQASRRLSPGARVGLIGVRNDQLDRFVGQEELEEAASGDFRLVRNEDFVDRQFLLVLEKD